jgi:organizing structure protein 2
MTPGLLYVGIATLTGSILARNRVILTRLFLPPLFLVASANHFLPQTTGNLSDYLGSLEDTYFPALALKHEVAKAHSLMTWERVKDATKSGRDQVNHGADVVVEKIQEATGLKLKETLGWRKEQAEKAVSASKAIVEQKIDKVEKKVEAKTEDVKPDVEQKVEEVKRLV